jgi:hypothetical protein
MSFLAPKPPKVVSTPAATPAVQANADVTDPGTLGTGSIPGSLISTGPQGLTRKATTRKSSLIGGSGSAN